MASLNTLRTRFGIVLSIVIALALLAFILSLKTEMGFSGNEPRVGVINGDKINYSEYYETYERVKAQSGIQESDEQQAALLANAAWQTLFSDHVLAPGFSNLGLRVTESERLALLSGQHLSQTFYNAFADPTTGAYDVAAVNDFLLHAQSDPQAQQAWTELNEQARIEREMQKYLGLVRGGAYVNALEVADGVNAANETFAGRWAGKRYASVPDSLFTVTSNEIRSYYNSHKNQFRQTPSRSISYVVFDVAPTDDDLLAIEKQAAQTGAEFAETAPEELRSFVRANRYGHIDDRYVTAAQLSEEEAAALLEGKTYGPVLRNNEWTMARAIDTKMASDTLGIRHIVLPFTADALADSLLVALRGGGDFAEAAAQYSIYAATAANGGEVGLIPFSALTSEFAAQLADAKKGDIVKIASGDAIQLMQVYRADKPVKHVQVASIVYPLEASEATRRDMHNQAGSFTVNAKKSFADAATTAAVTPRVATLVQGDRTVRGLDDSREVARWAYGAKVGDVSEIFTVGGDYVIATLTGIDKSDYVSVETASTQIRAQLLRDKKYDYIVGQLAGATLEAQAESLGSEVNSFEGLSGASLYLDGAGIEPRLVGAIASTAAGTVSKPVKGMSGVYVFQVDDVQRGDQQSAEGERVRAQAMTESMMQQLSLQAVQQMAEIQDLRGQYF